MSVTPDPFAASVSALVGEGGHRVWSLIVTTFGDMAQAKGAELSGAVLSRLTDPMGIKPEALRVALYRLRKDGWIESRRAGRNSFYSLTPKGRSESARATPRIYARAVEDPGTWHLLMTEPRPQAEASAQAQALCEGGHIPLGRGAFLGRGPAPGDATTFALEGLPQEVPDWLRHQLGPETLCAEYAALSLGLSQIATQMSGGWQPTPLQRAALRTLIVHSWRRIVLRHPDLPARFFPRGWRGEACRAQVHALLDNLPRPTPEDLESAL